MSDGRQFGRALASRVVITNLAGQLAEFPLVVDDVRSEEAFFHAKLGADRSGTLAVLTHLSITVAFGPVRIVGRWRTLGRETVAKSLAVAFAVLLALLVGRSRDKTARAVATLALTRTTLRPYNDKKKDVNNT